MAKTHPPYPPTFRIEAAELAQASGKDIPESARDLGVSEQAPRGWLQRRDIDAGRGQPGALTSAERQAAYAAIPSERGCGTNSARWRRKCRPS